MENESEIVADQEIFAEEKLSDDKILSINIKIKERLAVKLGELTISCPYHLN